MSGFMGKTWRLYLLLAMSFAQYAMADEVGLITEAHSAAGEDASYLTWFVFVVAVWFVVVIANTLATSAPTHTMGFMASIGAGPVAHHLYFPCRLGGRPGHIRAMSPRKAEVLIAAGLHKGEWLDLEIDTLALRTKVLKVSRIHRNGDQLVLLLLKSDSAAKRASIKTLLSDWSGAAVMDDYHHVSLSQSRGMDSDIGAAREATPVSSPR